MSRNRTGSGRTERGFTLFEVVLSVALAGILFGALVRSVASFVEVYREFHLVSELSQVEWLAAARIRAEIAGGVPGSLTLDPDGQGLSLDAVQCEGVVSSTDSKHDWILDPFLKGAHITADARLLVLRAGAVTPVETEITQVHSANKRIYYVDNLPGEPDFGPGDRYWTTRERVGIRKEGERLLRSLSICTGGAGACTLDRRWPLAEALSRFQVSWKGPGQPLEFEQQLAREGTVVGGTARVNLPTL